MKPISLKQDRVFPSLYSPEKLFSFISLKDLDALVSKNLRRLNKCLQMIPSYSKYTELTKLVAPLKEEYQFSNKTEHLFIYPYVSSNFSIKEKLNIAIHHYTILKQSFSSIALEHIFRNGIETWSEEKDGTVYYVDFAATNYEKEGSLSLLFKANGKIIYTLSFSFGPAKDIKGTISTIIYISRIQGERNEYKSISKAIKDLNDISPVFILIKILETIGELLDIKLLLGIPTKHHFCYDDAKDPNPFNTVYEDIWGKLGGVENSDGTYSIPCPIVHKPLSQIKQKHRKRALNKRIKLKQIGVISINKLMEINLTGTNPKLLHDFCLNEQHTRCYDIGN